jgi:SAM-dependent methyltransferase
MLLTKLISSKSLDPALFYGLQVDESIKWMKKMGVNSSTHPTVIDLGCGDGYFGHGLEMNGHSVTYLDYKRFISPDVGLAPIKFIQFDLAKDDFTTLGTYDLVVMSNTLEHLPDPQQTLANVTKLLTPGGILYLCWTNWLSPYGGHEFTPYHYLGSKMASWLYKVLPGKLLIDGRQPRHILNQTLFPTYIGQTLKWLKANPAIEIVDYVPRYYPNQRWIAHIPILREFISWNFAVLIRKTP